ncbi:DUF2231 domain-containing protein [Amycolatopsis regifaucium]|uniref:DUF2231 domain-containing protein n=1 Tax=Amycolatopsis regifaucium TaxID=546365 RepID=A0A154MH23_9PSEU|nr:DUF2231 domain-containing protein [Amycolatopsis regifaucium]KZB83751.1 hypothetical protein AVL48_34700 [Amycolatopsis regifaucium]OKA06809.1 DUF2231 domain-containing protein [Amycolatopsis regifaucium]SFH27219.1 Uncharacterized membrane protein [Amycolatopsis regifaucium]
MKPRELLRAAESFRAADSPSAAVGTMVRRALHATRTDGLLRGAWLGHPLHPLVVTVPLGAWISSAIFDLGTRNEDAARKLVAIGLAATPPAIIAGLADYADLDARQRRIGTLHAVTNTVATAVFAASYLVRRQGKHREGATLGLLALAVVSAGGALGGHLSYAQGAGVRRWPEATGSSPRIAGEKS